MVLSSQGICIFASFTEHWFIFCDIHSRLAMSVSSPSVNGLTPEATIVKVGWLQKRGMLIIVDYNFSHFTGGF